MAHPVHSVPRNIGLEPFNFPARFLSGKTVVGEDEPQDPVASYQELCAFLSFFGERNTKISLVDDKAGPCEFPDRLGDSGWIDRKMFRDLSCPGTTILFVEKFQVGHFAWRERQHLAWLHASEFRVPTRKNIGAVPNMPLP